MSERHSSTPSPDSITYTSYLKVDELLKLQRPVSSPEEHDEMLFIVIHQSYELWFLQILHESEKLLGDLQAGRTWAAGKTLRRMLTILKAIVAQIDILETMTPLEFNSFRLFLRQASGFQSFQFRELEILCGLRSGHVIKAFAGDPEVEARLRRRMESMTLWEGYAAYVRQRGVEVAEPVRIDRDGLIFDPSEEMQARLLELYEHDQEAAFLSELLVDFDEGMQEWRYRHVKMVERTIGVKRGTGGSDGAAYLHATLNRPIFPDLWAIRSRF